MEEKKDVTVENLHKLIDDGLNTASAVISALATLVTEAPSSDVADLWKKLKLLVDSQSEMITDIKTWLADRSVRKNKEYEASVMLEASLIERMMKMGISEATALKLAERPSNESFTEALDAAFERGEGFLKRVLPDYVGAHRHGGCFGGEKLGGGRRGRLQICLASTENPMAAMCGKLHPPFLTSNLAEATCEACITALLASGVPSPRSPTDVHFQHPDAKALCRASVATDHMGKFEEWPEVTCFECMAIALRAGIIKPQALVDHLGQLAGAGKLDPARAKRWVMLNPDIAVLLSGTQMVTVAG